MSSRGDGPRQLQAAGLNHQLSMGCLDVVRILLGLILLVLTACLGWLILPWLSTDSCSFCLPDSTSKVEMLVSFILQFVLATIAVVLILCSCMPISIDHACFAALMWGRNYFNVLARLELNVGGETLQSELYTAVSWSIAFVHLQFFSEALSTKIRSVQIKGVVEDMVWWFERIERTLHLAKIILCLLLVGLLLDVLAIDLWIGFKVFLFMSSLAWLIIHVGLSFAVIRDMLQVRCLVKETAVSWSDRQSADAQAFLAFTKQLVTVEIFAAVVSIAALMIFLLRRGLRRPLTWARNDSSIMFWIASVDCLVIACTAFFICSGCKGTLFADMKVRMVDKQRHKRWYDASVAWRLHDHEGWQAKVEDLAGRGITLEALLNFYKGLGTSHMQHYHAGVHRTLDVVRMAIIPASRDTKSALAPVMMGGACTRPGTMVTHSWNNLFRDLVAAVVADALGEDEFEMIAYLLEHDFKSLEEAVLDGGAQKKTYWICAFSVNQHTAICGENPQGTRDPITNELHPVCLCDAPKLWNHTQPTLNDGRAVDCEMNKFDDMIRYLSAADPDFRQVVAADASFELFSRAWCVSEISAANLVAMRQTIKVSSQVSLSIHASRLKHLRIEEMEASRPEDVQQILASIPDKAMFNRRVQELLFDELFPALARLTIEMAIKRVVRHVRWRKSCACFMGRSQCLDVSV